MTGFTGPEQYGRGPSGPPGRSGYIPPAAGAQQYGSPQQYGPTQQYGMPPQYGISQPIPGYYAPGPGYPPAPSPNRGRGALWLGLGIGAALVAMAVTLVVVFAGGEDAAKTPPQDHEAFVREFIVNSSTFSPDNLSRYEQAVDTYCDGAADKRDARRGIVIIEEMRVSSETTSTPSVEVMSDEATGDRVPVHYSVGVSTKTESASTSGTLTGTVYVRPGVDRCVIEVVEDVTGSGPIQTF
jgi:hypothetical protein